jgi:hypothetical protein
MWRSFHDKLYLMNARLLFMIWYYRTFSFNEYDDKKFQHVLTKCSHWKHFNTLKFFLFDSIIIMFMSIFVQFIAILLHSVDMMITYSQDWYYIKLSNKKIQIKIMQFKKNILNVSVFSISCKQLASYCDWEWIE